MLIDPIQAWEDAWNAVLADWERKLDLADGKTEALIAITKLKTMGFIKKWLFAKWSELVDSESFLKLDKKIRRYSRLASLLMRPKTQDIANQQHDWITTLLNIIHRCYTNSPECGETVRAILESRHAMRHWKLWPRRLLSDPDPALKPKIIMRGKP